MLECMGQALASRVTISLILLFPILESACGSDSQGSKAPDARTDTSLGSTDRPPPGSSMDAADGAATDDDAFATDPAHDTGVDNPLDDTATEEVGDDACATCSDDTASSADAASDDVATDGGTAASTDLARADSEAPALLGASFVNTELAGTTIQIRTWSDSDRALPSSGVIALWHLNESPASDGTVIADATGKHPALFKSDDGALDKSAVGLLSKAITFDGVGDHVEVPHADDLDLAGSWAISVWVNPASYGQNGEVALVDHGDASGSSGWALHANSQGAVIFTINGGGTGEGKLVSDDGALQLRRWTQVVVSRDADQLSLWTNGQPLASRSNAPTPSTDTSGLLIGGRFGGSDRDFAGLIDEVAIWDRALSSDEIRALWLRQAGAYGGGEVASYASAVSDSQETSHAWSSFAPIPAAPYDKALVTTTGEAKAYQLDGVDPAGLVGYWSLDGFAGAVSDDSVFVDRSAQANTGRAQNHGSATMLGGPGKLGDAVYFDGVDDTIDVTSSRGLLLDSGMMTLAGWAKPSSHQTGWHAIVGKGNWEYWLEIGGEGNDMRPEVGLNGAPPHRAVSAIPVPVGDWSFIAGTFDGATLRIYVNGVEAGNFAYSAAINQSSNPLTIGNAGHYEYFNGWIDEVSVWNRPLTADEILSLYLRGATRIKYQARSCARPDCSDAVFIGPDGTSLSFFTELMNTNPTLPLFNLGQVLPPNRYFQYQAIFETDNPSYSPKLLGATSR